MEGKKPLIFVYPLSDSLQKLKDIMSETAEENGLEIYEVDAAGEAVQLIPTVGQSLTLFSNPKKCAQILQASKKFMTKMNSKAILLSSKQMPRKTLDKFSKVGLTECIVEPVAPKTLLYKVNFIMRSIVAQSDDEDEEFEVKSLDSGEIEAADDNKQLRLEKGVLEDSIDEDLYDKKKKKKQQLLLESEEEEEEKKKKSNFSEESIETEWKGSVDKGGLDLEDDEGEEQTNYEDEDIETYYKGESKKAGLDLSEEEEEKKERPISELEDSAWDNNAEKSRSLELDEEEEEDNKEIRDEIDSYMRGKVGADATTLSLEEEEESEIEREVEDIENETKKKDKINNELMLDEEDDLESNKREEEEEEEEEEESNKRRNQTLELDEDDDSNDKKKEEYEFEEEEKEKKKKDELELEASEKKKKEEHELEFEDQDETQRDESEEIENYYKGKISKQLDDLDLDSEDENDLKKENELELEAAEDHRKEKKDLDLEEADDDYKKDKKDDIELAFDEDMYDREKPEDEEMENYSKKKKNELEFEEDDDNEVDKEDTDEDLSDDDQNNKKESLELDLDNDSDGDEKGINEEDDRGEFGRKKSSKDLDLEDEGFQKKAKMIEKDIGGHYSNKKSVQHEDYDWENLNNRFSQTAEEKEKKKQEENTLTYEGKDDLGEQTIDYSKLWEEFGGITIDREATKAKITGPKYVAGEKVDDSKTSSFYGDDENLESTESNAKQEDAEEEDIKPIHEPKPNGLDTAVKILNFYQQRDTKSKDVYKYIANIIQEEEGGSTSFLTMNKDKNIYDDAYISQLEIESDLTEVEKNAIWTDQKVKNQSRWRELSLPTWSDETFQNKELEFFYPYYEGVSDLGLAVIDFKNGITQDKVKKIEIILETARGLFLEEFHDAGSQGEYNAHEVEEKENGFFKKTIGKLFGGLFGKKNG